MEGEPLRDVCAHDAPQVGLHERESGGDVTHLVHKHTPRRPKLQEPVRAQPDEGLGEERGERGSGDVDGWRYPEVPEEAFCLRDDVTHKSGQILSVDQDAPRTRAQDQLRELRVRRHVDADVGRRRRHCAEIRACRFRKQREDEDGEEESERKAGKETGQG